MHAVFTASCNNFKTLYIKLISQYSDVALVISDALLLVPRLLDCHALPKNTYFRSKKKKKVVLTTFFNTELCSLRGCLVYLSLGSEVQRASRALLLNKAWECSAVLGALRAGRLGVGEVGAGLRAVGPHLARTLPRRRSCLR